MSFNQKERESSIDIQSLKGHIYVLKGGTILCQKYEFCDTAPITKWGFKFRRPWKYGTATSIYWKVENLEKFKVWNLKDYIPDRPGWIPIQFQSGFVEFLQNPFHWVQLTQRIQESGPNLYMVSRLWLNVMKPCGHIKTTMSNHLTQLQ